MTPRSLLAIGALTMASLSFASAPTIAGFRIATPPAIDGTVDDQTEWSGVPSFDGLLDIGTGQTCPETARFWLAYDDKYVYFAARLGDSQPGAIRANEYRTNAVFAGDDYVELDLDLSGTATNFNTFQLNPKGATNTTLAGGRAAKREWAGEIVSKGRITATGWEVEARIPWQIMQLSRAGKRDLRVNANRFISRLQRTYAFGYTGGQSANTPMWTSVDVPKQDLDRSIKLLPYGYAGFDSGGKTLLNSGLDLKTALADQVALVGSINPDFRNVENQILSLDFSRFERLAGESRPFFLEGRNFITSAIFTSQRISKFDVGLNSYGRLSDKVSYGLIDAIGFGQENDLALNLNLVATPATHTGIRLTDQRLPGSSNTAVESGFSQQLGALNLQFYDIVSQDTHDGFGRSDLVYGIYRKGNWNLVGDLTRVTSGYNPRLGFVPERNLQGADCVLTYSSAVKSGWLSYYSGSFLATSYNHTDNSPYRREQTWTGSATLRNGLGIDTSLDFASFEGSHDELYSAALTMPTGSPTRNVGISVNWGHQAGFAYRSVLLAGAYKLWNRMQLILSRQDVSFQGVDEQTIFGLNYDIGHDRAISGRAVRHGSSTNAYFALSQKGNLGTEYYLIVGDPNAATFRTSIILKVAIPFELGSGKKHRQGSADAPSATS